MSAPTKFLFDVDFTSGLERRSTVTPAGHATKLADAGAETAAHRSGYAAGKAETAAEAERRIAAALDHIASGLAAAGTALKTIEARLESEVVEALVGHTVAEVERDLILETVRHCLGNRTHAADVLGISIRTLRNKLNEYAADGIPVPPPGSGEPRGRFDQIRSRSAAGAKIAPAVSPHPA
jgi:DNA-binding protein Fis